MQDFKPLNIYSVYLFIEEIFVIWKEIVSQDMVIMVITDIDDKNNVGNGNNDDAIIKKLGSPN